MESFGHTLFLYTLDLQACVSFFTQLFDAQVSEQSDKSVLLSFDQGLPGLHLQVGLLASSLEWTLDCGESDDFDDWHLRAQLAQAALARRGDQLHVELSAVEKSPTGRSFVVCDPDGRKWRFRDNWPGQKKASVLVDKHASTQIQ